MSEQKLMVSTRKGLFVLAKGSAGWGIEQTAFLGDPVSLCLPDAGDGKILAALNLGHFGRKLRASTDGGATWADVAAPAFPEKPADEVDLNPMSKKPLDWSVQLIWALERGTNGVLWAGTIPGAVFKSTDDGASWELLRSLWDDPRRKEWFGGGYDDSGLHSICIDPRNPDWITVGVSCGGSWRSEDAGATWELRADGMVADFMPPPKDVYPNNQDPHSIKQCPAAPDVLWCQHHNGVFKSTDCGRNWERLYIEPSAFGFPVAVHPKDPDTAWFVPAVKDECRVPVDGELVVTRTRDGGKSFEVLRSGLPQEHCYDLVFRHALDVDKSGDVLAFGSTTGGLWISEDGGDNWTEFSSHLPPIYAVRFG